MSEIYHDIVAHTQMLVADNKRDDDAVASDFNTGVFWLVNLGLRKYPDDGTIFRLKNLLSLARSTSNSILITEMGVFFYKYSAHIMARNKNAFSADRFETELGTSGASQSDAQLARDVFKLAHSLLNSANERELDEIFKRVIGMLNDFLVYAAMQGKK
jgi:hypothetical protein